MDRPQRFALRVVIGSAVIAALLAIALLLFPDRTGDTTGDIALTALTAGGGALVALCLRARDGRGAWLLRAPGGLAALVAAGSLVWTIWDDYGPDTRETVMWVSLVLAVSIAQVCLVLAALGDDRTSRLAKIVALVAIGANAALSIADAVGVYGLGDDFTNAWATAAILDAVASLWVWARRLTLGNRARSSAATLDGATLARAQAAAAARGVSPSVLVDRALDAYLDASVAGDRA